MGRPSQLLFYTFLVIFARALNVVSVLLYARSLPPDVFGTFAFLQTSTTLIVTISSFNLTTPITVALAQGGGGRAKLENSVLLVLFAVMTAAVMLSVCVGISFAFPPLHVTASDYAWFALFTTASAIQVISTAALIARGKPLHSAFSLIVTAGIVCAVLSVAGHELTLSIALIITAITTMIGMLLSIFWLMLGGFSRDSAFIAASLKRFYQNRGRKIILFSANSFASAFITQFALWYLQRQLLVSTGPEATAVFALSSQLYNIVIFLPGIFGPLLLRHLSAMPDIGGHVGPVWKAGIVVTLICVIGIATFHVLMPLIAAFMPVRYQLGEAPLILAVAAGALMFIKFPFSVYFQAQINAVPEFASSLAFSGILLIGASCVVFVHSATASLLLRAIAHLCQLVIAIAAFMAITRRRHRKSQAPLVV